MVEAIMGGLAVATALTLVFLPALYVAWFRLKPPVEEKAVEPSPEPPSAGEAVVAV
jgi:hypothetical protein